MGRSGSSLVPLWLVRGIRMVVDYAAHGLANPKAWNRPACKVYSHNRSAGSFYYEPMIEYIDRKSFMGADVASKAVQMHNVETRRRTEFPEAHEMPAQSKEFLQGPLRLSNFGGQEDLHHDQGPVHQHALPHVPGGGGQAGANTNQLLIKISVIALFTKQNTRH